MRTIAAWLITAICLLSGCARVKVYPLASPDIVSPSQSLKDVKSDSKLGYIKAYPLGQPRVAHIGTAIAAWQEATTTTTKTTITTQTKAGGYSPDTDFSISGEFSKDGIAFDKEKVNYASERGNKFYCVGYTEVDGKRYYVIGKDNNYNAYFLLIDENGLWNNSVLIDRDVKYRYIAANSTVSAEKVVFRKIEAFKAAKTYTDKTVNKGLFSELLFGGVNNITLNITYREYSPDAMARQAFYQNLVYQTSADTIRFRDFKIKIHEITNEKIIYTILEDGLPDADL